MASFQGRPLPFFYFDMAHIVKKSEIEMGLQSWDPSMTTTRPYESIRPGGLNTRFRLLIICIILSSLLIVGCHSIDKGRQTRLISKQANDFFIQKKYGDSLRKYKQLIQTDPETADRVYFEMGIIHAHPGNKQKDYQKAMDHFQKIVNNFPDSDYRRDSQMMILQIRNVIIKDKTIAAQQGQIDIFHQKLKEKQKEISALKDTIESFEKKLFKLRTEPADKILIEKKARRLSLISEGEVIKTYKIALGGDPVGPKERQGDNKTPEGIYTIESRNRDSAYHLSLRISYPNEIDKMRAKKLGASPGGDIMIHGIKNGLSWVGSLHARIDWTKGCIAVTDEEMEEIERLVPDGTLVEIRP